MKIALFGYGKMGHEVETAAIAAGHSVVQKFDLDPPAMVDGLKSSGAECAIDFSSAASVLQHVELCVQAKVPLVIGTTGWDKSLAAVNQLVEDAGIGCVAGSNFSIGVNLFLSIVRHAAKLLDSAGYDAYILEAHHRAKKDFPSGTALRLAEAMLEEMKSKSNIISELSQGEAIAKDALLISSIRSGAIPGTHTACFESEVDTIELTHRARSRRGFATGAVTAAEWIIGKKGFYRFEEHIGEILRKA